MRSSTEAPRFRDYDSQERGTLCLLYSDGGHGDYLGMVYKTSGGWFWEADTDTCAETGCESSRRAAKGALRNALQKVR